MNPMHWLYSSLTIRFVLLPAYLFFFKRNLWLRTNLTLYKFCFFLKHILFASFENAIATFNFRGKISYLPEFAIVVYCFRSELSQWEQCFYYGSLTLFFCFKRTFSRVFPSCVAMWLNFFSAHDKILCFLRICYTLLFFPRGLFTHSHCVSKHISVTALTSKW